MAKDNINGIAYNTKTAEVIARNGSRREVSHSDERWYNETLYRKRSGEFFLYGSGGIFTKYAKQTGPNSWERSDAILPLTEDEVKQWAMNNLDDNGYKNICQKIEEKPVPAVKEKRHYTHRENTVIPEEVETIIDSIRQNPSISQIDLAQKTGLSRSTVIVIMDTLKDAGRLTRVGSHRKGQWVIDGDLKVAEPQVAEEKKVEEKPHETKTVEKKPAPASQNNDNERVDKILDALRKHPDITQRALAKDTGISLPKVNAIMQQLVKDGTVIREGTNHKGKYIVSGKVQTDSENVASAVKKQSASKKVYRGIASGNVTSAIYDVTQRIIDCIRKNPSVTQTQLAEAAGIGKSSVIKILNRLRDDKKILRTGSRKTGKRLWVDDIADQECITIYGMDSCPDCQKVKMQLKPNDDRFRYVDIGADVKFMKEFLRLRDSNPVFDSVKNHGIGIPCFVHQDGRVTLKPEEVGLLSGKSQGKACRIDGSGC